jgi:hypothetical protein
LNPLRQTHQWLLNMDRKRWALSRKMFVIAKLSQNCSPIALTLW